MEEIIVGADFGQSESTFVWRDKKKEVRLYTMPSMVGTGSWDDLRRLRQAAQTTETEADDMVIEQYGVEYLVGHLAMQQAADATTERGNMYRYNNGHTLKLLLAWAGRHLPDDSSILLVTGTPIEAWSKERKQLIQRCLVGTHDYTYRDRPRTLTVEGVGVMIEGRAVLYDVCHEDVPQAVLDIGGGSYDIFYAEGNTVIREKCKGLMVGVEKIGELVSRVAEGVGRPLEANEVRKLLRHLVSPSSDEPVIYINGRPWTNATVETVRSTKRVADELLHFTERVLGKSRGRVAGEVAHVRLIGGGYYYFGKAFKMLIPHLRVPSMPENQNALSYHLVGESTAMSAWDKNRG